MAAARRQTNNCAHVVELLKVLNMKPPHDRCVCVCCDSAAVLSERNRARVALPQAQKASIYMTLYIIGARVR